MATSRRRDERGSAAAFVVGMAVTLLVVAGLVVDGGGALNARMTLADDVEAAAVAGAQATDELRLRGPDGDLVIDPDLARERVHAVLAGRGYGGIVVRFSADYKSVTVTAHDTVPTLMLNLIGINDFDIEATATSEAEILE